MTPQEKLELEVLEYIYEHDEGTLREPANLAPLYERFGEERALTACQSLRTRGLIDSDLRLSGGYHVLPAGRTAVETMRTRRNDRGHRRVECREQLLAWLDANSSAETGVRPAPADFDGGTDLQPFTAQEVNAAITHLNSRGLVATTESFGGPSQVWITESGRDAIDAGGVAAAEKAQRMPLSVTNTFHMAGEGNVFATATASGATATANVSNFNLQHAKTFAAAIRSAEPDLDLTDDDRAALVQIETIQPGSDLTLAQRATARLYESAGKVATGAAGGILAVLAKKALGIEG